MSCIKKFAKLIDFFGSPFFFTVQQNRSDFRTIAGGVYSILIILSTIAFSISRLTTWYLSNVPIIIQYLDTFKGQIQIPLHDDLITIQPNGWNLTKDKQLFIPILHQVNRESYTNLSVRLSMEGCLVNNSFCLKNSSFNFIQTSDLNKEINNLSYQLILYKCTPDLLYSDESCASDAEVDNFFETYSDLKIYYSYYRFNYNDKKIDQFQKIQYGYIDRDQFITTDIFLLIEKTKVVPGYPFRETQDWVYISDGQQLQYQINAKQGVWKTMLKQKAFAEFYFEISKDISVLKLNEPLLTDQLAFICSFYQILYFTGFIFYYRASKLMLNKIKSHLKPLLLQNICNERKDEKQLDQQFDELLKIHHLLKTFQQRIQKQRSNNLHFSSYFSQNLREQVQKNDFKLEENQIYQKNNCSFKYEYENEEFQKNNIFIQNFEYINQKDYLQFIADKQENIC